MFRQVEGEAKIVSDWFFALVEAVSSGMSGLPSTPSRQALESLTWGCRALRAGSGATGAQGTAPRNTGGHPAAIGSLFARAARELAELPDEAREGRALRSLVNHREGLTVFVDRPHVPMDNNLVERLLRGPVIGRRLSFGSDSETGAKLAASCTRWSLP